MENGIKLQKAMADCGVASRRKAEEMIAAGEVKVNGAVAQIGARVVPGKDKITVKGKLLVMENQAVYIMLHKPRGFITTMSDEMERKCVAELIRDIPERVYPVGRLDRESEGLLLMTNDGAFANAMTHPSHHVPKLYRVTVRPRVTEDQLVQMQIGIVIEGRKTAPASVRVLQEETDRSVLEIQLHEGRNRQIRKMCEQLGLEVARLKRIGVGPLRLGMLAPGKWRALTPTEVSMLKAAAEGDRLDGIGRKSGNPAGKRRK